VTGETRVPIAGTHRDTWPGSTPAEALASTADVLLTVWLRPKKGGEIDVERARTIGATPPPSRAYAGRKELALQTGADDGDVERFTAYCKAFGITIVESHWRSLVVSGPLDRLVEAFGATVATFFDGEGKRFRHRSGALHAGRDVAAMVRGIFGLHQWPRSRRIGSLQRHETPLMASDVAKRYDFPDGDGSGQTIGILQFRGEFKPDDFDLCMRAQGVSPSRPVVKRVDGAAIAHEFETTKDLEAALDAQVVASLAPGARIVLYEAPDDERGFLDAIRTALFDEEYAPSILSISYGWPEFLWTPAALDVLNDLFAVAALLGVSVFCSSGDNGAELDYDGKPHVLAPASSPYVQACGGTTIAAGGDAGTEAAWEKSGGGFSDRLEVPSWQTAVAAAAAKDGVRAGRGVPDVAAQQDPGYCVYLNATELCMGGTSAVAPMWAALAARINQRLGVRVGFFAPLLYERAADAMRDVSQGNNGRYEAAVGWDPCTGLGVPTGNAIEAVLRS